jgi:fumarate hydratase class II
MNVNEVVANRAQVLKGFEIGEGEQFIKAMMMLTNHNLQTYSQQNAHCSLQSSRKLHSGVEKLRDITRKSNRIQNVVKIGRTHLMDATPLTVGQELSGYVAQLTMV